MGIPAFRPQEIESAVAAERGAREPKLPAPAAGSGGAVPGPVDLVARALAILDEESAAWQARQVAAPPRWRPR